MSNQLVITVNAPIHHGSLTTSILLKVLLERMLPNVSIALVDGTIDAGPQELTDHVEAEMRDEQPQAASSTAEQLNEFFARHDVQVRIVAQNYRKSDAAAAA